MFSIYFFSIFLAAPLLQIGGKCKQSELANCRRTIFHNFQPVELKSQQKKGRKKSGLGWKFFICQDVLGIILLLTFRTLDSTPLPWP